MKAKTRIILHNTTGGMAEHFGSFTVNMNPHEVMERLKAAFADRRVKAPKRKPVAAEAGAGASLGSPASPPR